MGLSKEELKKAFAKALKEEQSYQGTKNNEDKDKEDRDKDNEKDADESLNNIAEKFAAAIIAEIKKATITYSTGLSAGNVPVIGTFNGTIS